MIRPLQTTQLSSAKPRTGLQKISELLPRLIAQYELQAEAHRQIESDRVRLRAMNPTERKQTTFSWYGS